MKRPSQKEAGVLPHQKKRQLTKRILLISLFFVSLISGGAYAQDINDIEKDMSFPGNLPEPRFIFPMPDTISGVSIHYSDLRNITSEKIRKLKQIKTVNLQFSTQSELDEEIKLLVNFPSMKYLILTEQPFRSRTINQIIRLPEILASHKSIQSIKFTGSLEWDHVSGVKLLKQLPNLNYLFFEEFNKPLPQIFNELTDLKGISLKTTKSCEIPNWISEMKKLESVALKLYNFAPGNVQHAEFFSALVKLQTLPVLKSIYLYSMSEPGGDFSTLKFPGLKKIALEEVDFSSNPTLAGFLTNPLTLESLMISGKTPRILGANFSRLKNLRELSILGRRDTLQINFNLGELAELKSLKLSNVKLILNSASFPDNLSRLELSSMNLGTVPPSLLKLSRLKTLSLIHDSLAVLPAGITGLRELEYLDLQGNLLNELPAGLGKLKRLNVLNLSSNPITDLPESLGRLDNLKVLEIRHGNLKKFPSNIGNLQKLETLDANDNFLERVPESITGIKTLKKLDLANNHLVGVPEQLGDLATLEILDLDYNGILRLPGSIGKLQRIKKIGLRFNALDSIPEEIGKLSTLEELNLNNGKPSEPKNSNIFRAIYRKDDPNPIRKNSENKIRNFPLDLSNWHSIKKVNISNNTGIDNEQVMKGIFSIPAKNFSVDLSNCGLISLPQRGWQNFNAGSMNLGNNKIDEIPTDIANAPFLSSINLANNNLQTTPVNLNQYIADRYEKALWFVDLGIFSKGQLPETDSMVLALIKKGQNHYYRNEFRESAELGDMAMRINDSLARKNVFLTNLGEAYFRTGNYKKAIDLLTMAIRRDTAGNVRIMNVVIPDFEFRARSYLQLGDTASAIKDYRILTERYQEKWGDLALLLKATNNAEDANRAFENGIKFYQDQIRIRKENKWPAEMYQLSMLELMIVKEDFNGALIVAGELEKEFKSPQHLALLQYLRISAEIANGSISHRRKPEILESIRLKRSSISNWSFDLFLKWLQVTRISHENVRLIREVTSILRGDI